MTDKNNDHLLPYCLVSGCSDIKTSGSILASDWSILYGKLFTSVMCKMLKDFGMSFIQLRLSTHIIIYIMLSLFAISKPKQTMCTHVWYDLISKQNIDMCLNNENHLTRGFLSLDLSCKILLNHQILKFNIRLTVWQSVRGIYILQLGTKRRNVFKYWLGCNVRPGHTM